MKAILLIETKDEETIVDVYASDGNIKERKTFYFSELDLYSDSRTTKSKSIFKHGNDIDIWQGEVEKELDIDYKHFDKLREEMIHLVSLSVDQEFEN